MFFVQPGMVFWMWFEEEERIDGNLGLVYRSGMADDVIGGVSIFYGHDFQIRHQRIGVGVDVQRGGVTVHSIIITRLPTPKKERKDMLRCPTKHGCQSCYRKQSDVCPR